MFRMTVAGGGVREQNYFGPSFWRTRHKPYNDRASAVRAEQSVGKSCSSGPAEHSAKRSAEREDQTAVAAAHR